MSQNMDNEIKTTLLENDIIMPEKCRKRILETIQILPDRRNEKWHKQFWPRVAIIAACILTSSIPVFAAVDYVKQRMESLSEEEKDSYYEGLQNSPANADSYSRELTDKERERMEELKAKYENGTFPIQKLAIVKTQSNAENGKEIYFVEDTSLFVLPARELTEEELLEIIDFNYSRDYSLKEKLKENIGAISPKEATESAGMDEQKAIAMAKADISKVYGIDCENLEASVVYNGNGENGSIYTVNFTDDNAKANYGVSIEGDQETVTQVFYMKQSSNFAEGIQVDQAKFTAKYQDALDLLKKWKGEDLPILHASCEYNYNAEDCLERGMVSYLFELEDGSGYVIYYSCVNDVFFQAYMADYHSYRQTIDQAEAKKKERGINRKIIQMQ